MTKRTISISATQASDHTAEPPIGTAEGFKLPTPRSRLGRLLHSPWSRRVKLVIFAAPPLLIACAASGIYYNVHSYGRLITTEVSGVEPAPVAIVFGAGYSGHFLSDVLQDRVETGVELYKAGKVKKLLMTGDNGKLNYDEPDAMKRAAIKLGVPKSAIACDYAGFRTYDSLYRAHAIFGIVKAILVTQSYHLPRALFTANNLGISSVGLAAEKHPYFGQDWFNLREVAAVERAWWDVRLGARPKYLGKPEPLF